jgi:AcrR family transcriptional regulator
MKKLSTRSDAVKHRELLLDAAEAVFAESGVHVPLELVIERAGVSRATLYRNFVDRGALITALVDRGFDQLEVVHAEARTKDDGLFVFLGVVGQLCTDGAPLLNYWEAIDPAHPVIDSTIARFTDMLRPLLRRCKDAGLCRADLSIGDLVLVCRMLEAGKHPGGKNEKPRTIKRVLNLCLEGLMARPRHAGAGKSA